MLCKEIAPSRSEMISDPRKRILPDGSHDDEESIVAALLTSVF